MPCMLLLWCLSGKWNFSNVTNLKFSPEAKIFGDSATRALCRYVFRYFRWFGSRVKVNHIIIVLSNSLFCLHFRPLTSGQWHIWSSSRKKVGNIFHVDHLNWNFKTQGQIFQHDLSSSYSLSHWLDALCHCTSFSCQYDNNYKWWLAFFLVGLKEQFIKWHYNNIILRTLTFLILILSYLFIYCAV